MEPYVASEIKDYLPSLDLATVGCVAHLHRCQLPKHFVLLKREREREREMKNVYNACQFTYCGFLLHLKRLDLRIINGSRN